MSMKIRSWNLKSKQLLHPVILLLLACLGIALVLYYSRYGPNVGGDSVRYLNGAENLLNRQGYGRIYGEGEIIPITSFPPFYSFVLTGIGFIGIDLLEGARIFNSFLFGVNVLLSGMLIYRYSNSIWASVLGCLLILTSENLIGIHGWIMTEPLFIFFMLFNLYILSNYIDKKKGYILIILSIVIGLSILTRQVGISLTMTGILSIFVLSKSDWKRRLSDIILLSGLSLFPFILWIKRNLDVAGTVISRQWIYHPMRGDLVRQYSEEVSSWLVPMLFELTRIRHRILIASVIFIICAALIIYPRIRRGKLVKDKVSGKFSSLPWILLLFIFSYIAVLVMSSTFIDAGTNVGTASRYLAPVYITLVIFLTCRISRFLEGSKTASIPYVTALLLCLGLIVINGYQSVELVRDPKLSLGYVTARIYWTDVIAELQEIDDEQLTITNNPELLYFLSNRSGFMIPIRFNPLTQRDDESFMDKIELTRGRLEHDGVIVMFGWAPLNEDEEEVIKLLGAIPSKMCSNAKFYVGPKSAKE